MSERGTELAVTTTTADDVLALFAVTPAARARLLQWRRLPGREHVVDHVMAHTTDTLYRITPEQIAAVCHDTDHALGDVRRDTAESITAIVDGVRTSR